MLEAATEQPVDRSPQVRQRVIVAMPKMRAGVGHPEHDDTPDAAVGVVEGSNYSD